jgi:hypothetical protein
MAEGAEGAPCMMLMALGAGRAGAGLPRRLL